MQPCSLIQVGHVMVFRSLLSGAPLRTEGIGMVTGPYRGLHPADDLLQAITDILKGQGQPR